VQTTIPSIEEILALDNRIERVEALPEFILRIHYSDGAVYLLDFKPEIARGGVMSALSDPGVFERVRVTQDGEAIEFPGEVDFCADALRWDAELASRGLTRADAASITAR